jgi:hypothetical protein
MEALPVPASRQKIAGLREKKVRVKVRSGNAGRTSRTRRPALN